LAEISKIFFSETNELTEPKLYMNDHWNVLYQVTVFYADWKSKMAATAGPKNPEQISSGSFNYLLNMGRVMSEGSQNNVSINHN
jgi:hypothetical protein